MTEQLTSTPPADAELYKLQQTAMRERYDNNKADLFGESNTRLVSVLDFFGDVDTMIFDELIKPEMAKHEQIAFSFNGLFDSIKNKIMGGLHLGIKKSLLQAIFKNKARFEKMAAQTEKVMNSTKTELTSLKKQVSQSTETTVKQKKKQPSPTPPPLETAHEYLDREDNTLGDELGEQLARQGCVIDDPGKCGKGVALILERFGIQGLPDTGRHGYRWDDMDFLGASDLTRQGQSMQFIKVKLDNPYDAKPGAVLVYEQGADQASANRSRYGHVEIRGEGNSRGKGGDFYHSSNCDQPGGSIKWASSKIESDPRGYRDASGYTGYVYYPVLSDKVSAAIAQIDAAHEGEARAV